MKKLMTSAIIILPLIILAILLVSGAIKSLFTHIYVESVEFTDAETLTLVMDDEENPPSGQLEVNVFPLKAANRDIVFSMGDEKIATVDANGKVVAKYYGTTTVTVTSVENKTKFAQKRVIVTDSRVHDILIHSHAEEIYVGDIGVRLTAEVLPEGANNKNIEWSTDAPADVLTIDKKTGIVTCLGTSRELEGGVVTVTATSVDNPEVTATTVIRCHQPLSGISAEDTPVITAQKTLQFPAVAPHPADATYSLAYTSSDTDIATVDSKGTIVFHSYGFVRITATARDGRNHEDTVSVDYDSTYGYYEGALFGSTREYTVDYDEILLAGGELPIHFLEETPEGSDHEITDVTFENPDPDGAALINYDEAAQTFSLNNVGDVLKLGRVKITVHANKYDRGGHTVKSVTDDVCFVNITRKTQSLAFVAGGTETTEFSVSGLDATMSISFSEREAASGDAVVVRAEPANHTDKIAYSLESACAEMNGTTLKFNGEGTATVTVSAESGAKKELTVTFTRREAQDKTVRLNDGTPEAGLSLSLSPDGRSDKAVLEFLVPDGYTARIRSDREDVVKVEGKKLIPQNGGFATITVTFEPVAGVSLHDAGAPQGYSVNVYVDRSVQTADIAFSVGEASVAAGGEFVTSKKSAQLTITLNAANGAMEGKTLVVGGEELTQFTEAGTQRTYKKMMDFGGARSLPVTAAVQYTQEAAACDASKTGTQTSSACTLRSTQGEITGGLTVKHGETLFGEGSNKLTFNNLGETAQTTLTFSVEDPDPADFVLQDNVDTATLKEALEKDGYLNAELNFADKNTLTAQLTARKGTYEGDQTLMLTVAGKTVNIVIEVLVPADKISVNYGDTPLNEGENYATFLSGLSFTVKLSRADGQTVSNACRTLSAAFNGEPVAATPDRDGALSFTVTVTPAAESGELSLTAEGGLAAFKVQLEKLLVSECAFTYYITYTYGLVEDAPEPRFEIKVGEKNDPIFFPRGLTSFELHIGQIADPNRLGNFVDDAPTSHFYIKEEGWQCEYHTTSGSAGYLTVTVPEDKEFFTGEEITFVCPDGEGGEAETTLTLTLPNVRAVSMTGYDNGVATDVYKGYQQVRVFAKHSDYGDGKVVDYYRVPFKAEASVKVETAPGYAVWNISTHNDKTGERKLLVTQTWTTVTYYKNGDKAQAETYTVEQVTDGEGTVKPSTLKAAGGTTIAEGGVYKVQGAEQVPWVDVFAEEGYAHIYFGAFTGLSETDIQNDLFGNFGEQAAWEVPYKEGQKNIEGKDISPSGGAFSYLRVAVGDGTVDSTQATVDDEKNNANTHFNFNILEDAALVNVFNATGYYAHNKLVLHNNLYGGKNEAVSAPSADRNCNENELTDEAYTKAKADDLILDKAVNDSVSGGTDNSSYANKNTVYGNGYQINLNALNTMIIGSTKFMNNNNGTENTGYHTQFINIYNVNLKGRNDTDKVVSTRMGVYFSVRNAYYSTIQNYGKLFNGSLRAKNTVFRNAAMAAIELWNDRNKTLAQSPACVDYLENVTIVNAKRAIILENHGGHTLNIKGYLDALNYNSFNEIKDLATGGLITDEMVLQLLAGSAAFNEQSIDKYLEWFGCDYSVTLSSGNMDGANNFFVNPMIIDTSYDEGATKQVTGKHTKYGIGPKDFYIDENGDVIRGDSTYTIKPEDPNAWVWTESATNVGGVGGVINVWDEGQQKYLDRKTDSGKSNFATPLSGLDHIDPRFIQEDILKKYEAKFGSASTWGNSLITGYTLNTPNTIDGGLCTVTPDNSDGTYSFYKFTATATRPYLWKLLNAERDIRLLCEYVDIQGDGTPILNTDHILWHLQKSYRDLSLVNKGPDCVQPEENAREPDHITALKQSLIAARDKYNWDGTWPDDTTLQDALDAAAPALAMNELLSETVIPSKRAY